MAKDLSGDLSVVDEVKAPFDVGRDCDEILKTPAEEKNSIRLESYGFTRLYV